MTVRMEQPGSLRKQYVLFLLTVALMAGAGGTFDSTFNNFLSDTFKISAGTRGWLELPREAPGFLVVLMTGILAALPITRMGAVGASVLMAGLIGLVFLGSHFGSMVVMMMVASSGLHLVMPVSASIALGAGDEYSRGKRLGQVGSVETLGVVLGTGFVWLFFSKDHPQYRTGFFIAGLAAGTAALCYFHMHIPHLQQPRAKIVVRRKFALYYLLEFLFGARKQIFLTFGPWVLIKVYGLPANSIAMLLMTAAIIGVFFKPLIGLAIDRFGERRILIFDGLVLILVCLGYGYALKIAAPDTARRIASACFVADNLLMAFGAARAVYPSRLADSPQETASSLAMGVSINHIVSMTIPIFGGLLWVSFGYERVFLAAAVLALTNAFFARWIPRKRISRAVHPDQSPSPEKAPTSQTSSAQKPS